MRTLTLENITSLQKVIQKSKVYKKSSRKQFTSACVPGTETQMSKQRADQNRVFPCQAMCICSSTSRDLAHPRPLISNRNIHSLPYFPLNFIWYLKLFCKHVSPFNLHFYLCTCCVQVSHSLCMEVRGQSNRISSLILLCGSWGTKSRHQA